MNIRHSKYKNTGILFELLVRQITSDTLDGKDSPVKGLLKKYFVKTELGREYKLYETLLKKTSLTETKANIVVNTLAKSSTSLNRGAVKRQKYNLIKEIKEHYDLEKFFNHKLPNYKVFAAFYTLLETYNTPPSSIDPEQIINNTMPTKYRHTTEKLSVYFHNNIQIKGMVEDKNMLPSECAKLTHLTLVSAENIDCNLICIGII